MRKLLCILLLVALAAGTGWAAEAEPECPRGYKGAYLQKGSKPKWGRAIKLCGPRFREQAYDLDLRYIRMKGHEALGPDVEVVLELISRQSEVVHVLRDGFYYGEFIDDKRTNIGTRTQRIALFLQEIPRRGSRTRVDVETLEYFYIVGDYEWSKTHVTKVKRVTQPVRIDRGANLAPLGPARHSVQYRRVLKFRVQKKPVPMRAENREALIKLYELPIYAEIRYFDPVLDKEMFFRRFEVKDEDMLTTVVPFVREKGAEEPERAIIYLYRGDRVINKFDMRDPKSDDLELNLEVGLT